MELKKEEIHINNKVLVKIIVPEIDESYDVYLPVNRKMGNIINLLNKTVYELSNNEFALSTSNLLYNAETGEQYMSDVLLIDTDIRNYTNLILLTK